MNQRGNPRHDLLRRHRCPDQVIDTAIDHADHIFCFRLPSHTDNAEKRVHTEIVVPDLRYCFANFAVIEAHIADQDIGADRMLDCVRDRLHRAGMLDIVDASMGQRDLERGPDMGSRIGQHDLNIVEFQRWRHRAQNSSFCVGNPAVLDKNSLNCPKRRSPRSAGALPVVFSSKKGF